MCGDHQCEQRSSRWSSWLCARRLFRFSPACHVPGGITTTILAFGLIAPDDAQHCPLPDNCTIILASSIPPLAHCPFVIVQPVWSSLAFSSSLFIRWYARPGVQMAINQWKQHVWPMLLPCTLVKPIVPKAQVYWNVSSCAHLLWFKSMIWQYALQMLITMGTILVSA